MSVIKCCVLALLIAGLLSSHSTTVYAAKHRASKRHKSFARKSGPLIDGNVNARVLSEAALVNWRNQTNPAHQSHGRIVEKIYTTSANLSEVNWVLQGAITTCLNLNPGFSLSAQDDAGMEAMVRRAAPALLPLWGLLKPIERADLWRYVVLYERGGWYIDSDVYCQKPFREWVDAVDGNVSFVVGIEAAGWDNHYQPVQLCQWVFGAAAGHPILARAIDFVVYRFLSDRRWVRPQAFQPDVLRTTGPWLFSMAVEEFLEDRHVSLRSIANITAPVVVDGVKILEFPRVRGDAHSGAPELGWVRHQLRGSWRAAAAKDAGSSSAERRS